MKEPKQRRVSRPSQPPVSDRAAATRVVSDNPLAAVQRQADQSAATGALNALQTRANGVTQREVDTSTSSSLPDYAEGEKAGWEKKDRAGVADWAKEDYKSGKGKTGAADKSSITENLRTTPRTDRDGRSMDPADGVKLWAAHEFLMEETTMIASMTGGKIGSIYFPGGRVRTTHAAGPAVEEHPQALTLQFNIDPTACWRAFYTANKWVKDMKPNNEIHAKAVRKQFTRFKVLSLAGVAPDQLPPWATRITTPDNALPEGTDPDTSGVKLFEIMLRDSSHVHSTHPSRGAAAQIKITRADLQKLKAVAKSLEGIPDAKTQNDAFYRYVTMKLPHLAHLIRAPDQVNYG